MCDLLPVQLVEGDVRAGPVARDNGQARPVRLPLDRVHRFLDLQRLHGYVCAKGISQYQTAQIVYV